MVEKTKPITANMAKLSQGTRTNVGKVDKLKTAWTSLKKQEQSLDKMPHKSTKRAKVKERQRGKKEIRRELNDGES